MVREDGAYANGRVHIELLPAELHGSACEKQFGIRRIEAVLSEEEQEEHLARELLKASGGAGAVGAEMVELERLDRFAYGWACERCCSFWHFPASPQRTQTPIQACLS